MGVESVLTSLMSPGSPFRPWNMKHCQDWVKLTKPPVQNSSPCIKVPTVTDLLLMPKNRTLNEHSIAFNEENLKRKKKKANNNNPHLWSWLPCKWKKQRRRVFWVEGTVCAKHRGERGLGELKRSLVSMCGSEGGKWSGERERVGEKEKGWRIENGALSLQGWK